MFESITSAYADPILGLADLFYKDRRPNKINLGIGVYKDEIGKIPVLNSVKKAEQYLLENETTKNYLDIDGLANFTICTQELLFGKESTILSANRACTVQTPGGTGALRIAADFLSNQTNVKRIWISNPSWPNHKNVFNAAGLEVCDYHHYNTITNSFDLEGMLESLQKAEAGNVILFHGCCHNPTGTDPTMDQWYSLARISQEKGWLPLFDFAYQGFAENLDKDAEGLRIFANSHQELIVASSYSKNFALYNERVGALTLIAANNSIAQTVFSQIKYTVRTNYSNPPAHGAAVVATILNNKLLRAIWEQELTNMRQRIQLMRQLFVSTLRKKNAGKDFSFIIKQNGMFSFSGLTQDQVLCLREKFGIYIVNSGRINIAGMTLSNLSTICEAIVDVI